MAKKYHTWVRHRPDQLTDDELLEKASYIPKDDLLPEFARDDELENHGILQEVCTRWINIQLQKGGK